MIRTNLLHSFRLILISLLLFYGQYPSLPVSNSWVVLVQFQAYAVHLL